MSYGHQTTPYGSGREDEAEANAMDRMDNDRDYYRDYYREWREPTVSDTPTGLKPLAGAEEHGLAWPEKRARQRENDSLLLRCEETQEALRTALGAIPNHSGWPEVARALSRLVVSLKADEPTSGLQNIAGTK